jgi:hypothetical protein
MSGRTDKIDPSSMLAGNQSSNESRRLALLELLCQQNQNNEERVFAEQRWFDALATQCSGTGTVVSSLLNNLLVNELQRNIAQQVARQIPSTLYRFGDRNSFSFPPSVSENILFDNHVLESLPEINGGRWGEPTNARIHPFDAVATLPCTDFEKRRMDEILRNISGPVSSRKDLIATAQTPKPSFIMDRIMSAPVRNPNNNTINPSRRPPHMNSNSLLHKSDEISGTYASKSCTPMCTTKGMAMTGREAIVLSQPRDVEVLSEYQCFVREQIEFFEANDEDISSTTKGRNTPIILGQVGIRCRHCAAVPPKYRLRGAMYYPKKMHLIYQAAQTIAGTHLHCPEGGCPHAPEDIKVKLSKLQKKKSLLGGGKAYWDKAAEAVGVKETETCLRFCVG